MTTFFTSSDPSSSNRNRSSSFERFACARRSPVGRSSTPPSGGVDELHPAAPTRPSRLDGFHHPLAIDRWIVPSASTRRRALDSAPPCLWGFAVTGLRIDFEGGRDHVSATIRRGRATPPLPPSWPSRSCVLRSVRRGAGAGYSPIHARCVRRCTLEIVGARLFRSRWSLSVLDVDSDDGGVPGPRHLFLRHPARPSRPLVWMLLSRVCATPLAGPRQSLRGPAGTARCGQRAVLRRGSDGALCQPRTVGSGLTILRPEDRPTRGWESE